MARLIQKHIKRQIISLDGGIQVIADLNAYYNFIASLKVPHLLQEFANLKMLGHVFVVDDAKDLAIIVRDVTRYGGSFRPEVSIVAGSQVSQSADRLLVLRMFTSSCSAAVIGKRSKRRWTGQCTI
jgi:hypothetical protein